MSRLFITKREINFISDINKEFIKDIVGQKIYYFPISETKTAVHPLYDEAEEKIWDTILEVEALVGFPDFDYKTDTFGPSKNSKLEVFIQPRDLLDKGIKMSVGDFVQYGGINYEITKIIELGSIFGEIEETSGTRLECVQVRKGQFNPPIIGPTNRSYSDPDAIQTEFTQQRGHAVVDRKETGDVRELQKNGTLEQPEEVQRVKKEDPQKPGSSSFYDDWET